MAIEPIITWSAPEHYHTEKTNDWYWSVGLITLALAAAAFIFGQVITGIFVLVAAAALIIHISHTPRVLNCEINDRGVMVEKTMYPFLTLDSFWIAHDEDPAKLIMKSRKIFMPFIVIHIDDVDPEEVRQVLLRYIAETEHHEPFLMHLLERFGF